MTQGSDVKEIPTILGEALEIPTPRDREEYLRQRCGDDHELRRRLNQLLEDYEAAGDFLEEPVTADLIAHEICEGPGTQIGPYKLREQIGEGGMGIVYLAEQLEPIKRRVALKLVKSGMDTRQVLARFEAERQALAMMSHPHISRILDAGASESGRPYFVMELVRGIPLTEYCDQHRLSVRQRLELFIQICQAVQHAHQRGIIHRDLKPSNILVELHDVTPVPKVIDFGIAKATGEQLSERTVYTKFVQMLGTPLYMSPEQATLSGLDIDTRSDIYSLGVILYELLTGSTPFDQAALTHDGPDEMRRIIREVDPPRPSQKVSTLDAKQLQTVSDQRQIDPRTLSSSMSRELDWVVLQALEKDRERRYESASAMAADLQRYLNNEAVLACPPSPAYRLRKFVSRNKVAITTAAIVSLSLLAGTAIATWQAIVANRERDRANQAAEKFLEESRRSEEKSRIANQERLRAEAAERAHREQTELAENALYASAIRMAYRHKQSGDDEQAAQLLDSWHPARGSLDLRGIEWGLLHSQLRSPGDQLMKLQGDVSCLRVSPEGSYVAAVTNGGVVQRYSLKEGRALPEWQCGLVDVRRMEFSPDGKYLALISYEAAVAVIETQTGMTTLQSPSPAKPTKDADVCFAGGRLLTTGNGGVISIWNVEESRLVQEWETRSSHVIDMASSSGYNGVYVLLDDDHPDIRARLNRFPELGGSNADWKVDLKQYASALAVSPDRRWIAIGCHTGDILCGPEGEEHFATKRNLIEKINELTFSPDSSLLAAAERNGVIHVWNRETDLLPNDWEQGDSHRHWWGHVPPARTVVFTPDSRDVISSGGDGSVTLWKNWAQLPGRKSVRVEPDSENILVLKDKRIIALTDLHALHFFDIQQGQRLRSYRLTEQPRRWNAIASDETGEWVACVSRERDILSGRLMHGLDLQPISGSRPVGEYYDFVEFLPGTRTLLTVEYSPHLIVRGWDVESSRLRFEYQREDVRATDVAFSKQSLELLAVTPDQVVRLDATTGNNKGGWARERSLVAEIALSQDGNTLAIGRDDRTVLLLDITSGRTLRTIRGLLSRPTKMLFSADDKTLLVLDQRGELHFWQVRTGSEILIWPSPSKIRCFDLSPDGQLLAVARDDTMEVFSSTPASETQNEERDTR